jgi:hypothetical protein
MERLATTNPEHFGEILKDRWLSGPLLPNKRGAINYLIDKCGLSSDQAHAFWISLPLKDPTAFGIPDIQTALKALKSQGPKDVERIIGYAIHGLYPTFTIRIRLGKAVWKFSFTWVVWCQGTNTDSFDESSKPAGFDNIERPKNLPAQNFLVDPQRRAYPLVRKLQNHEDRIVLILHRSASAL